jgi:nucleoside-diphosphate-sugar epimerase
MYLNGKRLFLAGGTGLAGSAVLRQVLVAASDVQVRIPHRGSAGAFIKDARVEYVSGDLTQAEDCVRLMAGCDCAVLAAARTGGARQARERPWEQVTDNIVLDARLLEALHRGGVRRAVYVSTASAYQDFPGAIGEDGLDWSADPAPAYFGVGWVKRCAEKLCRFWHDVGRVEILIARLSNVYGPFARFDPASSHFVAALVRKATAAEDPFIVWGSPYVGRDILFADDFGRAVVAMLEATDIGFDVFNIGSGRLTTVDEVAKFALRFAGHSPARIVYDNQLPTTVMHRLLDCSKARDVLGWQPAVTVEEGMRRTVEWWNANKDAWRR